jgi:hypothetical protein
VTSPRTSLPQRHLWRTFAFAATSSLLYSCASGDNITFPTSSQNRENSVAVSIHTWNVASAVAARLTDIGTPAETNISAATLKEALTEQPVAETQGNEIKLRIRRDPSGVMVSTDIGTELVTYCVEPVIGAWVVSNCAAQPVPSPLNATTTAEGSVERLVAAVNILTGRAGRKTDNDLILAALNVLGRDRIDGFGDNINWTGPGPDGEIRITAGSPSGDTVACAAIVSGVFAATDCP